MDTITVIWRKFEQLITVYGKSLPDLGFREGTTLERILAAESEIGTPFPEDIRQYLQLCNGQSNHNFFFLPDQAVLLSVDEIVTSWTDQQEFVEEDFLEEFYNLYHFEDKIRQIIHHPKRIPIAEQEGLSDIFIDFDPGPEGVNGQLIYNVTECDFVVLADSFTELMANYVHLLENGSLIFTEENPGYPNHFALKTPDRGFVDGNKLVELFSS